MRLIKVILSFIFTIICVLTSFAQKNTITGYVIDSISKTPLAYSTVRIIEKKNSKLLIGALTDTSGKFVLQNIPFSEYICVIDYLGYTQKKIPFVFDKDKKFIDFNHITLCPLSTNLQEVVIKGEAKTTTKIDRVIYKVDSADIVNAVTSLDVMKNVPDINVDLVNNSIGIKGKGASLILVNGVNREGQVDIRSINPEDIDKIEVISNPTSGVDSDIDGIINIILKEKPTKGFNTQIAIDYSPYKKSIEPYLMSQYGWKKVRFNIDYFFAFKGMDMEGSTYRENLTNNNIYQSSYKCKNPLDYTHIFKTGLDYYVSKSSFINFSSENIISNANKKFINTSVNTINDSLLNSTFIDELEKQNYFLGNYTLFYKKNFSKEGQEFTSNFNFHYMIATYDNKYNDELISTVDTTILTRLNNEIGEKTSYNLKLEYLHPINNNLKFTTGILNYSQFFKNAYVTQIVSEQKKYSNLRLNYYLDLYFCIKKIDFRVGSKIESYTTFIDDTTSVNQNKLLPSFVISKKMNNKNTLKLNYRTTAFYPSVWQLTPYLIYFDSLNASQGNSELKPQTLNKIEINHTYRKDGMFFSASLYYSIMQNQCSSIKYINNNNFSLTRTENISGKTKIGVKISSSLLLYEKIEIEPEINLFREFFNKQQINNSFVCSFSLGYYLPKDFYFGIYSSFNGKILNVQGYSKSQYLIDMVFLQKKILKGNASISLGYRNPFIKIIDETVVQTNNIYEIKRSRIYTEGFLFRFNYFITKGKKVEMEEINKIMDKDVK